MLGLPFPLPILRDDPPLTAVGTTGNGRLKLARLLNLPGQGVDMIELAIGALVIGLIHLMNVWTLNAFRRRAVQRHQTERAAQSWAAPGGGWPPPATGPAGA